MTRQELQALNAEELNKEIRATTSAVETKVTQTSEALKLRVKARQEYERAIEDHARQATDLMVLETDLKALQREALRREKSEPQKVKVVKPSDDDKTAQL